MRKSTFHEKKNFCYKVGSKIIFDTLPKLFNDFLIKFQVRDYKLLTIERHKAIENEKLYFSHSAILFLKKKIYVCVCVYNIPLK